MTEEPPSTHARSRPLLTRTWSTPAIASVLIAIAVAGACASPSESTSGPAAAQGPAPSTLATSMPATSTTLGTDGATIYRAKCAGCHGLAGEGNLAPPLIGVADRMTAAEQVTVVSDGRGTMLAFSPALSDEQIAAVVEYTRSELAP